MASRANFASLLAQMNLSHVDRAIAFLFYYRESQEFEERSATELAIDLAEEGFPRPNVTRLKEGLSKSKFTTRGSKTGIFRLDLRALPNIAEKYEKLLERKKIKLTKHVLPPEWVTGTRAYLEQIVYQINVSHDLGLNDACAVLMRRLMESLIIEIYIHENRHQEIQAGNALYMLDRLISYVENDNKIVLSRNSPKTMKEIKQLGDTAAHDRTYITPEVDVDDVKARYRRLIQELLNKAGITR